MQMLDGRAEGPGGGRYLCRMLLLYHAHMSALKLQCSSIANISGRPAFRFPRIRLAQPSQHRARAPTVIGASPSSLPPACPHGRRCWRPRSRQDVFVERVAWNVNHLPSPMWPLVMRRGQMAYG